MKYYENKIRLQLNNKYENSLFFDIETTGLSSKNSMIYLIGAGVYNNGFYTIYQWFAQNSEEEKIILNSFIDFTKDFKTIYHYNGNTFDIPFIKARCELYDINDYFDIFENIDIYRSVTPLKKNVGLVNLKQKSLELFLGIQRDDLYDGGKLIKIYKDYIDKPDEEALSLLLLHNYDDIVGLAKITHVYNIIELFNPSSEICLTYTKIDSSDSDNMIIHADISIDTRINVKLHNPYYSIVINNDKLIFFIHMYKGELKHFFKDYKNYYYLPLEDKIMHKSVAAFVDKEYREKAKADNCFVPASGVFLPQLEIIYEPDFRQDFKSKLSYFMYDGDFNTNSDKLNIYLKYLLFWNGTLSKDYT